MDTTDSLVPIIDIGVYLRRCKDRSPNLLGISLPNDTRIHSLDIKMRMQSTRGRWAVLAVVCVANLRLGNVASLRPFPALLFSYFVFPVSKPIT